MPNFQTYNIVPTLPAALEPLREVGFNLWWTWEPSARRLFRHLDPELWNRTNHNPIRMLQLSRQARLEELATDKTFLRELKQVYDAFQKYLTRKDTYGKSGAGAAMQKPVAYFSAEFGFHESIPNYSGGLGILSGNHCKSASALEMRMRQEIVLGIGGVNALNALGIEPDVFHMNEGHSAFLGLERIRRLVTEKKLGFYAALQVAASANVFTTHTPVPAGNDSFPREMMRKYFGSFATEIGLPFDEFFSFGQTRVNAADPFSMTILALRSSRHSNGVSKLHGEVSRGLWKDVWTGVPSHEVPITHITNGIHTKTWLAPEFLVLYDKYLGAWEENLTNEDFWRRVRDIPDAILWDAHQKLKFRLVEFVRGRVKAQRERIGESPESIRAANRILDPEILTIGFARRFATYKRGALLFTDKDRLHKLLNDSTRPVQFIFAGKAHPRDEGGKALIQEVYKFSRESGFHNRIVFVEDYDTYIARRLVQAVDLWLNNPLRPLEASGTSGMKTPPNGGLNLSILDGWWGESYNGNNGWAISAEIKDGTVEFQNEVDSSSLYQLLENQIIA